MSGMISYILGDIGTLMAILVFCAILMWVAFRQIGNSSLIVLRASLIIAAMVIGVMGFSGGMYTVAFHHGLSVGARYMVSAVETHRYYDWVTVVDPRTGHWVGVYRAKPGTISNNMVLDENTFLASAK